jgi:prepilin-type N-terminal cleavage/methylation domain-containing protein
VGKCIRRPGGFTLIELLVVIAIIAILAAILFPVFASAREKARASACLSNTKQMAVAVHTYMSDWDDTYPSTNVYPAPPHLAKYSYGFWMVQLMPHLKTWHVFKCPSAPHDTIWDPNLIPYANYGFNEYLLYSDRYEADFTNESALPRPGQTALIADCYNASLFHDWDDPGDPNSHSQFAPDKVQLPSGMNRVKYANGGSGGKLLSRHRGANIVYADAHAAYMPMQKFYCKGGINRPADPKQRVETPIIHPWAQPGP